MEELTRAKKRALYLLTDQDRTEKQLREKLEKTGYSGQVIEETIEYVRSFGYIDDLRYSVRYIEYYRSKKSAKRLRYDLLKKGVHADVIDSAFEEAGEWDERDQIRTLAEKKLSGKDMSDPKTYGKVANFLVGRGYRGDDIASVMREIFS
jgi:regulatory protein